MMKEIMSRGPIACEMCVTEQFEQYKSGVFTDSTNCTSRDHDITINGWGLDKESGLEYWIGRNSWGTYWGEDGWFRLKKGSNNLGVEGWCSWGVPAAV
jgi:cathepsin X